MILVPTSVVMYMVRGLMVSGSGIQAEQAIFLLLLVFVAMFAGLARRLKVPRRTRYQQGSVQREKRQSKADVWVFRWWESTFDGTSKRRKAIVGTVEAFPTEASALKAAKALRIDANQQTPHFDGGPETVAELVAHYRLKELVGENQGRKSFSTRAGYESYLNGWILPRWGDHRLDQVKSVGSRIADEIGPEEISDWIKSRKVSDATFNRYRAFVSLCYKEGVRLGKVKANVAKLIRQRAEAKGRKRYLSRPEYADLYAAIKDPGHKEEFAVSVLSGMRLTEQYTVEWAQVDFERDEINLSKTENGDDRTVMMNSEVKAILEARKARIMPKRKDRVFPRQGETFDTRSWFHPAMETAEIEDYVWHCNRHTFCSWLAIAGVPLKTIQELAGHKTISITAQYAHLCPDHKQIEVEKILTAPQSKVIPMERKKA
jgi:integrase